PNEAPLLSAALSITERQKSKRAKRQKNKYFDQKNRIPVQGHLANKSVAFHNLLFASCIGIKKTHTGKIAWRQYAQTPQVMCVCFLFPCKGVKTNQKRHVT
ncbi:MAG: hypothetical protein NT142_10105, partial [Planctomycetota bacterium]|nr:hypothetical protein [Planctomycetota bacterium]